MVNSFSPELADNRFFNISADLMCVAGFDGYFKFLNPSWEQTLQYSIDELKAIPLIQLVHPDDQPTLQSVSHHLTEISETETVQFENRVRCQDGSYRWLQWTANALPAEKLVYAIARDITTHKEIEQALTLSETRFRLAFENAPIGIALVSQKGGFLKANKSMLNIFGYDEATFQEMTLPDLAHPDSLANLVSPMAQWQANDQQVIEFEQRCLHRSGYIVWALFTLSRTNEFEDGDNYFLVQAQDITERQVMLNQLQEVNKVVTDFSARIKQVHRLSTFNYESFDELFADYLAVGCAMFQLSTGIISQIDEEVYTVLAVHSDLKALQGGQVFNLKETYCEKVISSQKTIAMGNVGLMEDLCRHPAYINLQLESYIGTPLYINGKIVGTINFSSTSSRKNGFAGYEYELIELMGDSLGRYMALAQAEKARDSATTALAQKTQELIRSNEELTQFAYIVSHDVRAPLRALRTYCQFLDEDFGQVLTEKGRLFLNGIQENASHLDALVVSLLAYSRIGRVKLPEELVDIRELIVSVIRSLQLTESADWQLPETMPNICARYLRLEQIFANLFSNAIKFQSKDKHPIVKVSWQELSDCWEFSVEDNGIGIEEKYIDRVFGVFQRLHTHDEYEGTGIGLAIVKKAVAEHNGQISVYSQPNKGTKFTFTIAKINSVTT